MSFTGVLSRLLCDVLHNTDQSSLVSWFNLSSNPSCHSNIVCSGDKPSRMLYCSINARRGSFSVKIHNLYLGDLSDSIFRTLVMLSFMKDLYNLDRRLMHDAPGWAQARGWRTSILDNASERNLKRVSRIYTQPIGTFGEDSIEHFITIGTFEILPVSILNSAFTHSCTNAVKLIWRFSVTDVEGPFHSRPVVVVAGWVFRVTVVGVHDADTFSR